MNCLIKNGYFKRTVTPMRQSLRLNEQKDNPAYVCEATEIAQRLVSTDLENVQEIQNLIVSFSTMFKQCKSISLTSLSDIGFQAFLIKLLSSQLTSIITECTLLIMLLWFERSQPNIPFPITKEIIAMFISIGIGNLEVTNQSRLLALVLTKRACCESHEVIQFLLENSILNQYVEFYKIVSEVPIKDEILKNIYVILHSEPHPSFDQISVVSDLFYGLMKDINNPNLQCLLSVAAVFIECGSPCAFVFTEIVSIQSIFEIFPHLPNDSQYHVLYILMHLFDSPETEVVGMLANNFNWGIVQTVAERGDPSTVYQFSRMLCSIFARCPYVIPQAANANVFQLLFLILEKCDFQSMRYTLIALIHAFRFDFQDVGLSLISMGIFDKMISLMESGSTVILKEVIEALKVLLAYASMVGNQPVVIIISNCDLDSDLESCDSDDDSFKVVITEEITDVLHQLSHLFQNNHV